MRWQPWRTRNLGEEMTDTDARLPRQKRCNREDASSRVASSGPNKVILITHFSGALSKSRTLGPRRMSQKGQGKWAVYLDRRCEYTVYDIELSSMILPVRKLDHGARSHKGGEGAELDHSV